MRIKLIIWLLLVATVTSLTAQQLPTSNIYSFDMKRMSDSIYLFSNPQYLTQFNAEGYNNQPQFINEDELYITVQMADDTTQTDIYSLNLKTGVKTQITATAASEYSAAYRPSPDEDLPPMFTCVRVENDGRNTQRLWQFPLDRSDNGKPAFADIYDVGYYSWVKSNQAAMFIVGAPHRMIMADATNETVSNITSNIGRCMVGVPLGYVYYVHKQDEETWLLKILNTKNKYSELIIVTPENAEDFVVLSDGTVLMASGSKIYKFNRKKDLDWIEIADFSYYGIDNISRLAVNGDKRLVLVEN